MTIVPYEEKYFKSLYQCFNQVFSVSKGKLSLEEEAFAIRLNHKLSISPKYSRLLIIKEQVEGFVLQTVNEFEKSTSLYNGGTGVSSLFRNHGYGKSLLSEALQDVSNNVNSALLEVVASNEAGISLYDKLGYQPRRLLRCFIRKEIPTSSVNSRVSFEKFQISEEMQCRQYDDFETSFIDSWDQVAKNYRYEIGLKAYLGKEVVGYVIFQPHLGRISRLAVGHDHRQKNIGSALLKRTQEVCKGKSLTFMNIPKDQLGTIAFLQAKGFKNEINQIEMVKEF